MSRITINGKTYDIPACSQIKIVNGKLFVDGRHVEGTEESRHTVISDSVISVGFKEDRELPPPGDSS